MLCYVKNVLVTIVRDNYCIADKYDIFIDKYVIVLLLSAVYCLKLNWSWVYDQAYCSTFHFKKVFHNYVTWIYVDTHLRFGSSSWLQQQFQFTIVGTKWTIYKFSRCKYRNISKLHCKMCCKINSQKWTIDQYPTTLTHQRSVLYCT